MTDKDQSIPEEMPSSPPHRDSLDPAAAKALSTEGSSALDNQDSPEPEVIDTNPAPPWVSSAAGVLPVLMAWLGTGRQPWALAIAAAVVGLLAVVFPPKQRVPVVFLAVAGAVLFFTLLPLIPLPWPHWPDWRTSLQEDFLLALPSTWSPQPWVTLEHWCAMFVMMVWFFWSSGRPWPTDERIKTMRILASGYTLLSLAAIVCFFGGWKPPGWNQAVADIGPYANRNHFSCLMAMTALLCFGVAYELQRRKHRLWMLFALGFVPLLAVTILNTSRAGLVLFFVGTLLWFLTSAIRGGGSSSHRTAAQVAVALAVSVSVLFVIIATVVLFGKPLAQRFGGGEGGMLEAFAEDSRLAVYSQAAPLAVDQPMMGIGLGNFSTVFGLIHTLPNAYNRYRHPESDWLWFLCEAGWPATFALLLGVVFIFTAMESWRPGNHKHGRRERRMRRAAGLAFVLSVAHGMVDTPNHDVPHFLLVLLLGALSLRPSSLSRMKGYSIPNVIRGGGVIALLASGFWLASSFGLSTPFGESTAERNIKLAREELDAGHAAQAYLHVQKALEAAPGQWEAWFLKGAATLKLGRPQSEAMADFGLSRYLEPHITKSCMSEASLWLAYNPANALPAWREALRRDPPEANNLYRQILDTIGPSPELRATVRDLANRPGLLTIFLAKCGATQEGKDALDLILQRYPTLESLSSGERQLVISQWMRIGDRAKLNEFLATHPALEPDTWQTRAQMLAEQGKVEAAFKLLQLYVRTPSPSFAEQNLSPTQLERDFQIYPSDVKRGLLLYASQRDRGQWDAALATLEKIAALPNRPRHVFYEMAAVHGLKGDFAKAWQLAQQYLNIPE